MSSESMQYILAVEEIDANETRPNGSSWVAVLVFLLLLSVVGLFAVDRMYHPEKFRIKQIEVRGQYEHVNDEQVKQVVENSLQGNYFSASLGQVEQRIEDIPWVYKAALRRQWPSTLVVEIEEVQPIAEWGEQQWLNASGDLVKRESWEQTLPVLRGPQSMQEIVWRTFQQWHDMFASHGLSLDSLELDERELWYLQLSLTALAMDRHALGSDEADQDVAKAVVTMIVDNSDASARIQRLIDALNTQLIAEFPGMRSIDLRYPNGFAINWINDSPDNRTLTESE